MSIHEFIKSGNVPGAMALLDSNPSLINSLDQGGFATLTTAAWCGHMNIVLLLLSRGADLNVLDDCRNTALIWSVVSDHTDVAKLLISRGADVNTQNQTGMTALLWSILKGHLEIALMCIDKGGPSVNRQDANGYSPLISASREGCIEIVHKLLDYEADVNAQSAEGYSALYCAIEKGRCDIAKLLLRRGAATQLKTKTGDTALIFACGLGNNEMVTSLLEFAWKELDIQGNRGDTALIRASANGHLKIVLMLLDNGAATDIKNSEGMKASEVAKSDEIRSCILMASIRQKGGNNAVERERRGANVVGIPLDMSAHLLTNTSSAFDTAEMRSKSHDNEISWSNGGDNGTLRNEVKILTNKLEQAEKDFNLSRSEAGSLHRELDLSRVSQAQLSSELESAKREIEDLRSAVDQANGRSRASQAQLSSELESAKRDIEGLRSAMDQANGRSKDAQSGLATVVSKLQVDMTKEAKRAQEAEERLEYAHAEITRLCDLLSNSEGRTLELEAMHAAKSQDFDRLLKEFEHTAGIAKHLEFENNNANNEVIRLQGLLSSTSTRNDDSEREINREMERLKSELEASVTSTASLESMVARLQAEVARMAAISAEAESKCEAYHNEINFLRGETTHLKMNVGEMEKDKLDLLTMKEDLSNARADAAYLRSELEKAMSKGLKELDVAKREIAFLKQENADVFGLREELSTTKSDAAYLRNELERSSSTCRWLQLELEGARREMEKGQTNYGEELSMSRSEAIYLRGELEKISSILLWTRQELDTSKLEISALVAARHESEQEKANLDSLREDLLNTRAQAEEFHGELDKAKAFGNLLEEELETGKQEINQLKDLLSKLESEKAEHIAEVESSKKDCVRLENELENAKKRNEEYEKELLHLHSRIGECEQDKSALQNELDSAKKEISELTSRLSTVEGDEKSATSCLREAVADLNTELCVLRSQLKEKSASDLLAREEVTSLNSRLGEADKTIKELRESESSAREEVTRLQSRFLETGKTVKDLYSVEENLSASKSEAVFLRSEFEKAVLSSRHTQDELEDAKMENTHLKSVLSLYEKEKSDYKAVREEATKAESEVTLLRMELENALVSNRQLRRELDGAKKELLLDSSHSSSKITKTQGVDEEFAAAKVEIAHLKNELEKTVSLSFQEQTEWDETKKQLASMEIENAQLSHRRDQLTQLLTATRYELESLKSATKDDKISCNESSPSQLTEVEVYGLNTELEKLRAKNSQLQTELDKSLTTGRVSREELDAAKEEIRNLTSRLGETLTKTTDNVSQMEKFVIHLQSELDKSNEKLKETRVALERCETTKIGLEKQLLDTEEVARKARSEIQTLKSNLEKKSKEVLLRQKEADEISSSLATVRVEYDLARAEVPDLKDEVKELNAELETVKKEIVSLKLKLGEVTAKATATEAEFNASCDEITELTLKVERLEKEEVKFKAMEHELTVAKKSLTSMKTLSKEVGNVKAVETELEIWKAEVARLQDGLSRAAVKTKSLERELDSARHDSARYKSELVHSAAALVDVEKEKNDAIPALETKLYKALEDLQAANAELSQLRTSSASRVDDSLVHEMQTMKLEVVRLKQVNETIETRMKQKDRDVEGSKSEQALLMRELGRSVSKLADMEKELKTLRSEQKRAPNSTRGLDDSQKMATSLKAQVDQLTAKLAEVENQRDALSAQLITSVHSNLTTDNAILQEKDRRIEILLTEQSELQLKCQNLNTERSDLCTHLEENANELKNIESEIIRLANTLKETNIALNEVNLMPTRSIATTLGDAFQILVSIILERDAVHERTRQEANKFVLRLTELDEELNKWKNEAVNSQAELERNRPHFSVSLQNVKVAGNVPIQLDAPYIICRRDLERITNSFAESRVIGRGASSIVYCGQIGEIALAVKRLEGQPAEFRDLQLEQFTREILVSNWKHEHLLSILGVCLDPDSICLVYPLVERGSLQDVLNDPKRRMQMNWRLRLRLAMGVTLGLNYLHSPEDSTGKPQIVHRDVKPANILLGGKDGSHALLSDAGIARDVNKGLTFTNTSAMGTPGYIDPLHMRTGDLNYRSDIYSLGIVFLQLLTGVPSAVDRSLSPPALIARMEAYLEKESYVIAEPSIWPAPVALGFGKLIRSCLSLHIEDRPESCESIYHVLNQLNSMSDAATARGSPPNHVKNGTTDKQKLCLVCAGERPVDTRLYPCMHTCLCFIDASALVNFAGCCPVCSVRIHRIERQAC